MELNLTPEQKMTSLTVIKNNLVSEIFTGLIRLGIDPDTFTSFDDVEVPMHLTPEKDRIAAAVASLNMVNQKLSELS